MDGPGTAETAPVLRPKQSKYVAKVTLDSDACQISKTNLKAQTEVTVPVPVTGTVTGMLSR